MINIANKRECFFDDYLIDAKKTTAKFLLHEPQRQEVVIEHTESWEGNGSTYHNMFYDNGIWRLYYLGRDYFNWHMRVCYAESKDGINWVKPKLNICNWKGSTENNIILDGNDYYIDNCFVFKDSNPNCPPEKKYKAILQQGKIDEKHTLFYFYSSDALHFTKGEMISNEGAFDSLNVAFWDEDIKKYRCYFRSAHTPGCDDSVAPFTENHVRDIRYIESKDFKTWTKQVILKYNDDKDFALYTNQVQKYYRAPHILIGFPTRYVYRKEWTPTYDELGGKQPRLERMGKDPRFGLAITDCLFMCSRNGKKFKRYSQAFISPEMENGRNWAYGDCYPSYGMIETPSKVKGAPNEISIYARENPWVGPGNWVRYTLRLDGFVSLHADEKEKVIYTKPFVYSGSKLKINFRTSSWGCMNFTLIDEFNNEYLSYETFGNTVDRTVRFIDDEIVGKLSNKAVKLKITLKDADLYSIKFE